MFNWFLEDKKQQPEIKFIPKIVIHPKSNLYVEVQPKDPTTTSNIAITAFASSQLRSIIPVRVEWSRFKVKSENKHTTEKIHCLVGNTYMCEPGDVGGYIQAVVRSVDETIRAEAQVTIGPIGIDSMIKRIIEGALYSGSLLSQVVLHQKERHCNINVRLNARTIEFSDEASHEPLVKQYTMSEPKIELNPKDPTRVYLRFEHDQNNSVRQWLNTIFNIKSVSVDQSSISLKVPYSAHSSSSSKMRLFQKSHGPCINKMQLRFISRHSRDLFLFTKGAFVCKEDMKNSAILQRIQTLQNIVTEQDYFKFLSFMSLKQEIFRIADYAKEIQQDRNFKVKDLQTMQQSIGQMTMTYLKIIEEKGKNQRVDFEHSYSQISITRQQIMNRKNIRQLKTQNQNLKQRLREMNEEIELLKFFKKQDNESMIFNQTSNPFAKKGQGHDQSVSYQQGNSPQMNKSHRSNMYEMSINYANLLQENRQLKAQLKINKQMENKLDRSQNMMELLGSLDERQQKQIRYAQNERITNNLKIQNQQLKKKIDQLLTQHNNPARGISLTRPNKSLFFEQSNIISNSLLNQSSNSAVGQSYLNQSMTSEAAFMKLEDNLKSLSTLNTKLQENNTRLRRQRDHYRNELMKSLTSMRQLQNKRNDKINPDDSVMIRYKQENESLQNQRNSLLRKLQSLSRQNSQGLKEEFLQRQRKIKQLQQQVESYRIQNSSLKITQVNPSKQNQSDIYLNESVKLKKINSQLLEQIKMLKIQLQKRCGDNMYNSRVIQLENELHYFRNANEGKPSDFNTFLQQINDLTKINAKLQQHNQDQQAKIETQTYTIQKLMAESLKSGSPKNPSNSSTSSKQKCYSQRANQPSVEQIQKYKRQIKKLQQQIILMKRSADAINRSRDLSMDMDGYYEQKLEVMKQQIDSLYSQNQDLSKMCERYGKDAREATKELNKWRDKATNLMKCKTEENSLISN